VQAQTSEFLALLFLISIAPAGVPLFFKAAGDMMARDRNIVPGAGRRQLTRSQIGLAKQADQLCAHGTGSAKDAPKEGTDCHADCKAVHEGAAVTSADNHAFGRCLQRMRPSCRRTQQADRGAQQDNHQHGN
jgi:hypothetical protein